MQVIERSRERIAARALLIAGRDFHATGSWRSFRLDRATDAIDRVANGHGR